MSQGRRITQGWASWLLVLSWLVGNLLLAVGWNADRQTRGLVITTIELAVLTALIAVPLGTFLACLIFRTNLPGRRLFLGLNVALVAIPLVVQGAAWQGAIATVVQGLLVASNPWAWWATVWIHALAAVPWCVLIVGAGVSMVEPQLEELMLLELSTPWVMWQVTLRRAWPAIGLAAIWTMISTSNEISITDLFQVRTFAEVIYTEAAIGTEPGEVPIARLPSTLWLGLNLVAALGACTLLVRATRNLPVRRPRVFSLGNSRLLATVLVLLLEAVLALVPLVVLLFRAGMVVSQTEGVRTRGWSLVRCVQTIVETPWRFASEIGWSLQIAALAAIGAVIVGAVLAWWLRTGGVLRWLAMVPLAIGFAVPGPALAIVLIELFNQPLLPPLTMLYDHTVVPAALAIMLRGVPWTTLLLWHAFRTIPAELLDAARMSGMGSFGFLWRVAIPMRASAVVAAALVVSILALGDVAGSILLVPPGVMTLSIQLFQLIHYGVDEQVAGISLFMAAVFALLSYVLLRVWRVWED